MKSNLAIILTTITLAALISGCAQQPENPASETSTTTAPAVPRIVESNPQEIHLGELRMLTDGGENAEAYFSFAGDELIFQSTRPPYACDQIFTPGYR